MEEKNLHMQNNKLVQAVKATISSIIVALLITGLLLAGIKLFLGRKIEKVFTNTNKNTTKNNLLYDKIRVYTHQNYLRITLESPSNKFSDNNVFKVKVQKNKNADAANKKVKISFYYLNK